MNIKYNNNIRKTNVYFLNNFFYEKKKLGKSQIKTQIKINFQKRQKKSVVNYFKI